jgi:endoplasmic reticulum-Golgi intermediate compartment protein 3
MDSSESSYSSFGTGGSQYHTSGGYNGGGSSSGGSTLRRRNLEHAVTNGYNESPAASSSSTSRTKVVRNLDFMFPKVDAEYTVTTDRGGAVSIVAYVLVSLLALAECISWATSNQQTTEKVFVDTSLGKRMRVNLNITFPSLACEDLHLDVMDVAGDAQ